LKMISHAEGIGDAQGGERRIREKREQSELDISLEKKKNILLFEDVAHMLGISFF